MSTVTPLQTSFNGGELSRRMDGRIDQNVRSISVKAMTGWVPLLQGPAETCPGTIFVNDSATPEAVLIPFGFTVTQQYVLELTAHVMRFFTNEVRIETAPGTAYQIATPWTAQQAAEVSWEQSADVLYLFHPDVQTHKLTRTSAVTFSLTPVTYAGGPFETRNADQSAYVTASNVWGNITIVASKPLFEAGDVGGLFRIEANDLGTIGRWEPGITVTAGQLIQSPSLGIVYQALSAGKTGTVEPTHGEGVEYDGMGRGTDINGKSAGGVQWQYLHDRYGLVRITGFVSATEITAKVERRLPFTVSTGQNYTGGIGGSLFDPYAPIEFDRDTFEYEPSTSFTYTPGAWRWQFGSFSNRRGWPACGAVWNERLCVGKDNVVYGSVEGDFENHAPLNEFGDPSRDMAFQAISKKPHPIRWMVSDEELLIGTEKNQFTLRAASASSGVGPGNVAFGPTSKGGAMIGMPVELDGRVVFVQRARRRIVEYAYQFERNRFETPELTRFAQHLGASPFTRIAMQEEPVPLLWALREDGTLAVALYDPTEQAIGWATRELGGGMRARSIVTIRDSSGNFDQLWIAAASSDGTKGHILRLARLRLEGEEHHRQVMLDAATIWEGPSPTALAAPQLAGRNCVMMVDGVPYEVAVQSDGTVYVPEPGAEDVIVGLPFRAEIALLPFEAGGENGPAQMKLTIIKRLALRLLGYQHLTIEVQGSSQSLESPRSDDLLDRALSVHSGDRWVQTVGKFDREGEIIIHRTHPYPATLIAVMAEADVQQAGGR